MKRDTNAITGRTHDLLIIGGGIYGATLAWEAASRGLSVALIEMNDFGSATSANSLKTIHGGLRYLQHADFARMRESIRERKLLMGIAPHLVHPLPVLIPTYGHGIKGREAMAVALTVNDLVSFDRNHGADPQKRIPRGYTISREACLNLVPSLRRDNLSGAALFHDAQVYNSERLILAFLQSAEQSGACVANYVRATGFIHYGDAVTGVVAEDRLTGDMLEIQARLTVNAAGPWIHQVLEQSESLNALPPKRLAKAFNIITRSLFEHYAVGVSSQRSYRDPDALINRGTRLYFVSPWRGCSMIGTEYIPYDGHPDDLQITEKEILDFLADFNEGCPDAQLTLDDVDYVHAGLLPTDGLDSRSGDVRLTKHFAIQDHRNDGTPGLISVLGVKYTTARNVAEHTIDYVFKTWNRTGAKSVSAHKKLYGGQIDDLNALLRQVQTRQNLAPEIAERLVQNYGTNYTRILEYAGPQPANLDIARAEVIHAVRDEMAQKLGDVIFRRTEIGTAGHPGSEILSLCAETIAVELGWDAARIEAELQEVEYRFPIYRGIHDRTELADSLI